MKKSLHILSYFFLLCFWATSTVFSQGLLVNESSTPTQLPRVSVWPGPRPPVRAVPTPIQSYSIKEITVDAKIRDQVAEVNVSQVFVNTGTSQMEVSFIFPLPYDGAIDQLVLLVDGKEYPGVLQDAKAARKTYEDIVRRNRDPALLEWMGNGLFKTSVFPVPAGQSRTVSLRYSQLLRNENGVCDFLFPLSTAKYTAKPVEKLRISLEIESREDIKNVYSPTHEVKLKRPDAKRASISFEETNAVPSSDFRLLYDSGSGELSTRILSFRPEENEDGFFLLLASPKIITSEEKPIPKTVLFVLDKSGSMSGNKIVQARNALKFVLDKLNEGDTFNIITYNDRIEVFKPEILEFNAESRDLATQYCESIRAGGTTNIGDALKVSLNMLQDKERPNYVLFFTDGQPTIGEKSEMKLAEIAKSSNKAGARVFSFGVGFDVNARLLDRISRDNRGETEFVLPNENIEDRVARLFNRISSPMLTDVVFDIQFKNHSSANTYATNQVYPNGTFDLYAGQQLVVLGRYSRFGDVLVNVKGKIGENPQEFTFDGNFVQKSTDHNFGFIERLWAMRRIGEIIDQIDLQGQNAELIDELVRLSTKHGILTPYTSFLADENTVLTDNNSNAGLTRRNLDQLRVVDGFSGVAQRGGKMELQNTAQVAKSRSGRFDSAPGSSLPVGARPRSAMGPPTRQMEADSLGMGGGMNATRRKQSGDSQIPLESAFSESLDEENAELASSVPLEQNVQTINNRAFFQKGKTWIDSTLTEAQQVPEKIVSVKQFSDEYFKLIEDHGKELSQYLVFNETVLVNLNGQAYRFEVD